MKIPILLVTHDRPYLLERVLIRILKHTDWNKFELWILDNASTASTKKIISAFKESFKHINIYSSTNNQIAYIQNRIISKLKSDIYIKLDDDILVSERWTEGFVGVYERNHDKMCFGSVIIPVNGFGWIPFLDIMGYKVEFESLFPLVELKQDCMNVAIWNNEKVVEYFWNKTLVIDETTRSFFERQNTSYQDLICGHRYSIGAIIFSHKMWENMGGWYVRDSFYRNMKIKKKFENLFSIVSKSFKKEKLNRSNIIMNIILRLHQSELGIEEQAIYNYSKENNLIIPVTTQSIVFHYSFGPTDEYITKKLLLKIK